MRKPIAGGGLAAGLAAVAIWGLVPVGTRFFVLQVEPLTFNVVRFAFSGVAAIPFLLAGKPWRWPSEDQSRLLLCALLSVPGYNIPVALAAGELTAGRLGLLIATEPLFIVMFAVWWQRRPVDARVVTAALIAFAGVAITSFDPGRPVAGNWGNTLLVLAGAASWAAFTVLASSLSKRHGSFSVTGGVLFIGSCALIALSAPMTRVNLYPELHLTFQIGALGLASSLLGFLLWNHAASSMPSERLGLFLYLLPIVAVLAGAFLLGEHVAWPLAVGGVTTLIGVAIGEQRTTG